jgi:hypothetical protein
MTAGTGHPGRPDGVHVNGNGAAPIGAGPASTIQLGRRAATTVRNRGAGRAVRAMERHRAMRYGWPIAVLTVGMPVLFAFGLQGLAWVLPFLAFGFGLLARPDARIPKGAGWLILVVGWTLLSGLQVRGAGSIMLFAYRWSLFAGTLGCLLWLANLPEHLLPNERVERWLAVGWIWLMLFGVVAVVAPFDLKSPVQYLLGPLGRAPFIDDISRWRMAEIQKVLNIRLPRPSAPFSKTNGWGAAAGLLIPFFIKVWLVQARPRKRVLGVVFLLIGLVPMSFSVNRGMLVSVAVALVYLAIRRAMNGHIRPLLVLVIGAITIFVVLVATGATTVISDRLAVADDSNATRGNVYVLAYQGSLESPFIGHGAPRKVPNSTLPPIGTHGLVWYLMYVHGWPALIFFMIWLGVEVVRSARIRGPDDWWPHLCLVIAAIQVVFYGLLPQIVYIGIAAGLARRNAMRPRPRPVVVVRAPSPTRVPEVAAT